MGLGSALMMFDAGWQASQNSHATGQVDPLLPARYGDLARQMWKAVTNAAVQRYSM